MPEVRVQHLTKSFGGVRVLDDVSFTAADGELLTLLGPSGCGKTTTLMSIAGLQVPDRGRIDCGDAPFFDGESGAHRPAETRNLGIVFQTYAIWPHMTVADNVAFPLRIRHRGRKETADRVRDVLELVEMGSYAARYPHQLSGGQQQRVALARALAHPPAALLLDEPFSNLDAKLRERAREWFKRIQRTLRLTTIFVTHDQDEALSMSDQVIVMNAGRILQSGTPEEIYRRPTTQFVAEFVGQCNFLPGRVTGRTGSTYEARVDGLDNPLVVCCETHLEPGCEVTLAVRPENVHLSEREPSGGGNTFPASITATSFFGDRYRHELAIGPIRMVCQTPRQPRAGNVTVTVDPDDLIVLLGARAYLAAESDLSDTNLQ